MPATFSPVWAGVKRVLYLYDLNIHRFVFYSLQKTAKIEAVAHSLIVIIYHMLRDHQPYHDLGATYFETLEKERLVKGSVQRLENLGYTVSLQPPPQKEVVSV
jgi:hypothetical protein